MVDPYAGLHVLQKFLANVLEPEIPLFLNKSSRLLSAVFRSCFFSAIKLTSCMALKFFLSAFKQIGGVEAVMTDGAEYPLWPVNTGGHHYTKTSILAEVVPKG